MSETKIKRRETCDWHEQKSEYGSISTRCDNEFYCEHEDLKDTCFWAKFCIYCGGKIIPHFYVEEDDDAILQAEGE